MARWLRRAVESRVLWVGPADKTLEAGYNRSIGIINSGHLDSLDSENRSCIFCKTETGIGAAEAEAIRQCGVDRLMLGLAGHIVAIKILARTAWLF